MLTYILRLCQIFGALYVHRSNEHYSDKLTMSSRRVVITGLGTVCPLGSKIDRVWERLVKGESGIRSITADNGQDSSYLNNRKISVPQGCNVKVAALIPEEDYSLFKSDSKELSLATQYALYAAKEAMLQSNLIDNDGKLISSIDRTRIGVNIGSGGVGHLTDIIDGHEAVKSSYRKLSPYFVPKILMNMPASQVSIKYGLQGPIHSTGTACASGLHSIGDAFNFIRWNYADIMVSGGTEASITPLSIAAFSRMKALSSKSIDEGPSSPFDSSRDGFVIGEGSGLLVLEELSSAIRRKAPIFAEVVSYSINGDAYHISSPAPSETGGAYRGMTNCLLDSTTNPDDVGYINAHATSTPLGDKIEAEAIDLVFSPSRSKPLFVSSTKGATGHLLGAAGSLETLFTVLALKNSLIPPTLHLVNSDYNPKSFKFVATNGLRCENLQYAMKNSFGFGGVNGVLLLKKLTDF